MYNILRNIIPASRISTNEDMAKHNSFKIGGPADVYVQPASEEEMRQVIAECRALNAAFVVLGHGTNVLVPDEGLRAVVIQLHPHLKGIAVDGTRLRVEAGALLCDVAQAACKAGLAGLAFASGIPGTVGGAVCMNAGAYEGDIAAVCEDVRLLRPDGTVETVPATDMAFGYRHSRVQEDGSLVLAATFALRPGDPLAIQAQMDDLDLRRRTTQPDLPSAGSAFKRPPKHFAGKLISDCGLKGVSVGGAQVSQKHAGFIVNTGNATACDVRNLIAHVQQTVQAQFGVALEPEVKML